MSDFKDRYPKLFYAVNKFVDIVVIVLAFKVAALV